MPATKLVQTKYGPIEVTASSATKLHVVAGRVTDGEYDSAPLKINGVEIGIRYDLELDPTSARLPICDGWVLSHSSARPEPKNWRRMNDVPSDSARKKIREEVMVAAVKAVDEALLKQAERDRLLSQIERQKAGIRSLNEQLTAANAELRKLEDEFYAEYKAVVA